MKTIIISALMLLNSNILTSQVVINEIMYAPSDPTNEWFEIVNNGNSPADLRNWKWKDATASLRTISTQSFVIQQNSFAVICQDSVKFKNQYPELTGKLIQTVWSSLNNTGDNLILIMPDNVRSDSVSFQPAWGGNIGGYSLEKILTSGESNYPENWGTSIDSKRATPCKQNSLTPKSYDLYLKKFDIKPLYPSKGDNLTLEFTIRNAGLNISGNSLLNIYTDRNLDSSMNNDELISSYQLSNMNPQDSLTYYFTVNNIDTGQKQFIAKVIYAQDDDTLNNILIRRVYVSSNAGTGKGPVINEIMYDPLSGKSEWIEIYNCTGQSVNLKGWKYKEVSSTIILEADNLYLNPGDYFILAHDTTIFDVFQELKFPGSNQIVKISSGISLNNSGEIISITDSLGNIIDEVNYNSGWHNPGMTDTKGISLERINPAFGSEDRNNWSSCTVPKGGTPGLRNSIYTEYKIPGSDIEINPNPFSPDGDGIEDFTVIKYKFRSVITQIKVKVFDIKGRFIRELANNLSAGSEGTIIFNGYGNDGQKLRIGIYILLIEATDQIGGTVEIIKKPLVIAARL